MQLPIDHLRWMLCLSSERICLLDDNNDITTINNSVSLVLFIMPYKEGVMFNFKELSTSMAVFQP